MMLKTESGNHPQGCLSQGKHIEYDFFQVRVSQGILWLVKGNWKGLEKSGSMKLNMAVFRKYNVYVFCLKGKRCTFSTGGANCFL